MRPPTFLRVVAATLAAATLGACGIHRPSAGPGQIVAVGAENEYADVIAQIGGAWVKVAAIMSNPNSDPHSFEASPSVAATLAEAGLAVQNGLGYDSFMSRVENASPSPGRRVIDVGSLLGLPDSTPNPHLWYAPATMPRVAAAVAADLGALMPAHRRTFAANLRRFDASLIPWRRAIASFRRRFPRTRVATTEPVGDSLLTAAGTRDLTPFSFQADVMNGVDPAPQAVELERTLLARGQVQVLIYNLQVTDSLTQGLLSLAVEHHVPVVGMSETMPAHVDYQAWMLDEVRALERAVTDHTSTTHLP